MAAPAICAPAPATTHSATFGAQIATRSPRSIPASTKARAAPSAASARSANVMRTPSSSIAVRSAKRSAARNTARGMVMSCQSTASCIRDVSYCNLPPIPMEIRFSEQDEAFRREAAAWLRDALSGEIAVLRGRGGSGDDAALIDERRAWEKKRASGGWTCVGWPKEHGGRGCSLTEQVIFFEEYARAGAPGRLNHMGETLLGPTLIAFGSDAQKRRFLPRIVSGDEIWCQGYSEPNAGSDLANVAT